MDKAQLIKNYSQSIEEALDNMYSNGYKAGYTKGKKEVEYMRSTCIREKGENDSEYAKNWRDNTTFYGWCNQCKRPHSGRWAHMWEFCPWCGAKIDQGAEAPYPAGMDVEELQKPSAQEVDVIPDVPKTLTQRDLIRKDLEEALKSRISQFELINDAYKYNTLAGNVKDTLERWFQRQIYYPARMNAKEKLKDRITEPFWPKDWFEYKQKAFSITKRKLEDRTHVYVTLNFDVIDNIEQIICDDTLELYKEKWPEQVTGENSNE